MGKRTINFDENIDSSGLGNELGDGYGDELGDGYGDGSGSGLGDGD